MTDYLQPNAYCSMCLVSHSAKAPFITKIKNVRMCIEFFVTRPVFLFFSVVWCEPDTKRKGEGSLFSLRITAQHTSLAACHLIRSQNTKNKEALIRPGCLLWQGVIIGVISFEWNRTVSADFHIEHFHGAFSFCCSWVTNVCRESFQRYWIQHRWMLYSVYCNLSSIWCENCHYFGLHWHWLNFHHASCRSLGDQILFWQPFFFPLRMHIL